FFPLRHRSIAAGWGPGDAVSASLFSWLQGPRGATRKSGRRSETCGTWRLTFFRNTLPHAGKNRRSVVMVFTLPGKRGNRNGLGPYQRSPLAAERDRPRAAHVAQRSKRHLAAGRLLRSKTRCVRGSEGVWCNDFKFG